MQNLQDMHAGYAKCLMRNLTRLKFFQGQASMGSDFHFTHL